MSGTVKFFNNLKGWGLIEGDDGCMYFCHHTNIVDEKFLPDKFRTLKTNDRVSFEADMSYSGGPMKNAINVEMLKVLEW